MALRGNLRDFSLPDVFQLVAYSRKTGVLRIKRPDGIDGGVWFRDGDVFFARSDWHGEPLGERLVTAQRITPAALQRALAIQVSEPPEGRRLGRILVEEGYITEGVLEAFVQEQIQDTIFDLMRWDEGDFDFEVLPDAVEEDIGLAVSLENIVMEGSRRLEEWERIRKKIPSMDVVFKMATAPGEGSFEISLKPVEWSLLLLVDGTRTVAELARETSRTDFEVARIVYGLVSAGLLEFADEREVEVRRTQRAEREARELAAKPTQAPAMPAEPQPSTPEPEPDVAEVIDVEPALETPSVPETPLEPEAIEPGPIASEEPAEEPEFLTGDAPSAHDLSVFEEMVAAVLEQPAAPPAPEPVEPYEPGELPPSVGAQSTEPATFDASEAADILGLLPVEAPPSAEPEPVAEAVEVVEVAEQLPPVETPLPAEPVAPPQPAAVEAPSAEVAPAEAVPPAPEPPELSGDFERDLMSLGLGEAPVVAPEPEAAPATAEAPLAPEPEAPAPVPEAPAAEAAMPAPVAEPPVPEASTPPAESEPIQTEAPPAALSDLIVGAYPEEAAEEPGAPELAPEPVDDALAGSQTSEAVSAEQLGADAFAPDPSLLEFEALSASLGPVSELERLDREPETGGTEDLDALLESLDAEEPGDHKVVEAEYQVDDGVGLDFSGELNNELSALTGAARPSRPSATVNHLPEPGTTLQRDGAIDRATLLQIIDGIQRL